MQSELAKQSTLVKAALAVWQGDLTIAADWLRKLGKEVTISETGRQITWQAQDSLPAGGLTSGTDPNNSLMILLFATGGPYAVFSANSRSLINAVNTEWANIAKARREAQQNLF